jgi:hypothetical protein
MRSRLGTAASTVVAACIAVAATVLAMAVTPGTAAAGVGTAQAGGGFAPAGNVRTAGARATGPAVTLATGVPQSFCYVFVDTVFPDVPFNTFKAEWELDCRSRAVPTSPAPDVISIVMYVSVRTGNPYNVNQEIRRVQCFTGEQGRTTLRCPIEVPMQSGVAYYSQMEAEVYLFDAPTQKGTFFTLPTIAT